MEVTGATVEGVERGPHFSLSCLPALKRPTVMKKQCCGRAHPQDWLCTPLQRQPDALCPLPCCRPTPPAGLFMYVPCSSTAISQVRLMLSAHQPSRALSTHLQC